MFGKLQAIKSAPACRVGCAGGKCPLDWMPGKSDKCSANCGKVFEVRIPHAPPLLTSDRPDSSPVWPLQPFWDECGKMLTESKMGGMKEMGVFCECCAWVANVSVPDAAS